MLGVSRVAEQRPQEFSIIFEDVELSLQQHGKTIAQGADVREFLMRDDTMFSLHALVIGHYQCFFAGKVVISQTKRHPSLTCHLSHCRFVETTLAKQSNSGVEDMLSCRFATAEVFAQRRMRPQGGLRSGGYSCVGRKDIEHVQYFDTGILESQATN